CNDGQDATAAGRYAFQAEPDGIGFRPATDETGPNAAAS
ncbi:MAG: hypothetical protein ACI82F_004424, partial [Planctomycetota bacterium]